MKLDPTVRAFFLGCLVGGGLVLVAVIVTAWLR